METIYYLSTIIIIFMELDWLVSPTKKTNEIKQFNELAKLNEGKKFNEYSKEYKDAIYSNLLNVYVPIWVFIGIFTFQWVGFLAFILLNMLVGIVSRLVKFSMAYIIINWINSLVGLSFCIFIIINHYHLKIDLTQLLINTFAK